MQLRRCAVGRRFRLSTLHAGISLGACSAGPGNLRHANLASMTTAGFLSFFLSLARSLSCLVPRQRHGFHLPRAPPAARRRAPSLTPPLSVPHMPQCAYCYCCVPRIRTLIPAVIRREPSTMEINSASPQ